MSNRCRLLRTTLLALGLGCLTWPAVGSETHPRRPPDLTLAVQDHDKTCLELELEIAGLVPLTYRRAPGFYQDPHNGAAAIVGATIAWPFHAYFLLGYYQNYREDQRVAPLERRVAALRRVKAEKRCFAY